MANPTRKLVVTSTNVKKSGTNDKGKDWTLYEVFATGEDGQPIPYPLKTFANLDSKIGELVEYELEKQEHERFGVSYLLSVTNRSGGGGGGGLGKSVDELREKIRTLEGRLERVETALSGRLPLQGGQSSGGDDIPFG